MRLNELDISKSRLINLADDFIFNVRNKTIFLQKIEGYTYEELAEMYNLSTVRIKEIVKECLNKVSRHIES